jgi:hypothetical protein
MLHAICENSRLVCMNGNVQVWSGACKPIKNQEQRTMMQIIDRSYHHVSSNSTIPTMFIPLCLLSPQLSAAIEAVPVHRLDT